MSYEYEYQAELMFNAMIEAKLSDEQFKKIYFKLNDAFYMQYLPTSIKNNIDFIKEATNKGLYYYNSLPASLQNKEFITKGLYIKMITHGMISLDIDLYPQDEEIGLSVLENNGNLFYKLNEELKTNKDFIIKAIKKNPEVYFEINFELNFELKEELLNNKEILTTLLKKSPRIYYNVPEKYKLDKEILLIMLETGAGYNYIKDNNILNKTHNEEVILKALEKYTDAHKYVNQRYVSIIKKNNAKQNAHEFMKSYFLAKKFEEKLPVVESKVRSNKI